MTTIAKSLCWAAALIALALVNAADWIADKDANLLFALIPALWIASSGLGRSCLRKVMI